MSDGIVQRIGSPGRQFSQDGLDFAPHFLDGVEIRRIRRQELDAASRTLDGLHHALLLVGPEVVQNDNVAGVQLRQEDMEDLPVEDFAVGGRVDGHAGVRPSPKSAPMRVRTPQCPWGAASRTRSPRGARP